VSSLRLRLPNHPQSRFRAHASQSLQLRPITLAQARLLEEATNQEPLLVHHHHTTPVALLHIDDRIAHLGISTTPFLPRIGSTNSGRPETYILWHYAMIEGTRTLEGSASHAVSGLLSCREAWIPLWTLVAVISSPARSSRLALLALRLH